MALKSCFDCLGLVSDNKKVFTITSATDTNKKVRKVLFKVEVTVGRSTVKIPLIALEGLYFDMMVELSWLKEAKASILVGKGAFEVNGERLNYKSWPELALFMAEDSIKIYYEKFTIL